MYSFLTILFSVIAMRFIHIAVYFISLFFCIAEKISLFEYDIIPLFILC